MYLSKVDLPRPDPPDILEASIPFFHGLLPSARLSIHLENINKHQFVYDVLRGLIRVIYVSSLHMLCCATAAVYHTPRAMYTYNLLILPLIYTEDYRYSIFKERY